MTIDEHNAIINEIAQNPSDQARVTDLLQQLRTDYAETAATLNSNSETINSITSERDNLRSANMKLFVQLGSEPITNPNSTPIDNPTPNEPTNNEDEVKAKYDALFNEEGELK